MKQYDNYTMEASLRGGHVQYKSPDGKYHLYNDGNKNWYLGNGHAGLRMAERLHSYSYVQNFCLIFQRIFLLGTWDLEMPS